MLGFNDNNIYVGQIKQILKDFNLPKMRVYKEGIKLVPYLHYIKDNNIYYCNDKKELVFVDTYVYNRYYGNLTTNLRMTSNIYDTYTHKYLGRYLRFVKDFYDLDLMSMYNCFTNETVKNASISFSYKDRTVDFSTSDVSSDIYCVPVRFGEKYTIGINSPTPIEVVAVFYKNGRLIDNVGSDSLFSSTYNMERSISIQNPVVYDKLFNYVPNDRELQNEECLCLLIKVSSTNNSSVVVLEGDFTSSNKVDLETNKLLGSLFKYKASKIKVEGDKAREIVDTKTTWFGPRDFKSKLELLSYKNTTSNKLLATRLVEYLSENVITQMSEGYDIKKIQKELIRRGLVDSDYFGIWSSSDREGLYKFVCDNDINNNNYDVLSYVDKDVEQRLGGLE